MPVNINWDNLAFKITPTKMMFINQCTEEGVWQEGSYQPFGPIQLSPSAAVLNYGQGIFEGLKAHRTRDGRVTLFRPIENAKRFASGAERMCMPPYPIDDFVAVMHEIVRSNIDYLPPYGKGSLYLRPCLWGTGQILGVAPATEFTFVTFASPVGNYYKGDLKPIKLMVTNQFHRAAPKGVGNVKFIGNYTGGLKTSKEAKALGYNGCIYLDAREEKYVEEVGTSNFFCVLNGKLLTPALNSILPGITRDSIIQIADQILGLEVLEKNVSLEEALQAEECFCSGTAAVITPIGVIHYQGKDTIINNFEVGHYTRKLYDLLTQIQKSEREDVFGWVDHVDLGVTV